MKFFKNIKNLFDNLDKTILKIMKSGIKFCFIVSIFSVCLLSIYLVIVHNIFLYNLGLTIFRLSIYIAIEFVICAVVTDIIKKQLE